MEFIDFLKYGAIGISLALSILSYRLLSKEQDKDEVRIPILNAIRNYFLLAVFLSVFFGVVEIISKIMTEPDIVNSEDINKIWKQNFSTFPDSSYDQKLDRIKTYFAKSSFYVEANLSIAELQKELDSCKAELEACGKGGFEHNIANLKRSLINSPDGWVNLAYKTVEKEPIIKTIKDIFNNFEIDCDTFSNEQMVEKWKSFKGNWATNRREYIFNSDLDAIASKYLKTYYTNFEEERQAVLSDAAD